MRIKCPLCSFECEDVMVLVGHLLSAHKEEKEQLQKEYSEAKQAEAEEQTVYRCEFCGKEFTDYSEAREHIEKEHSEELNRLIDMKQKQKEKPKKRAKK